MRAASTDVPQSQAALTIVNAHLRFPQVSMMEPSSSHFGQNRRRDRQAAAIPAEQQS